MTDPSTVHTHVIIPARDEEHSLGMVLDTLSESGTPHLNVVVVDNGSTDGTSRVAEERGVRVVWQPLKGYGSACLAGLAALHAAPDSDIVAFIDADGSDDPRLLPNLVSLLEDGDTDLVLASRTMVTGEHGALSVAQRIGNRLACSFIRLLWHVRFTDLAPCRALTLGALRSLGMTDRGFGWTVQMQVRAAKRGFRFVEIPSRYRRRRAGRSKISGTVRGGIMAGATILAVIARESMVQHRKTSMPGM